MAIAAREKKTTRRTGFILQGASGSLDSACRRRKSRRGERRTGRIGLPACAQPASQAASGTVTDAAGRSVTIKGVPKKIVSLSPSNTEVLYALGLGDQIVNGLHPWGDADESAEATQLPELAAQGADLVLE